MFSRKTLVLITLLLLTGLSYAKTDLAGVQKKSSQEPHFSSPLIYKSPEEYEITKIDITTIPNITSLKISVNGVKLGDQKNTVQKLLGQPDEINEMGIYFYKDKDGPLFAVVFDTDDTVRRIVLFPGMAKLAIGNTKRLFSHLIAVDEELRYYLLGVEDDKIKSPTGRITFKYLKEGFEFTYVKIGSDMEDFMFFLKYPAKIR